MAGATSGSRRPRSRDRAADRRDRPDDDDRDLRLRSASLRGPRPVHRGGLDPRPRADGHRGGGGRRGDRAVAGRPRGHAVPGRVRKLLHVRPGPPDAVRDHAGARGGDGGDAVRLHQAVRHKDGGQAEFLRVPHANYSHIKVPEGPPDERFVYLSDVLPTAWQAVEYADDPGRRKRHRPGPRPDRRHGRVGSRCTRATA